MPDFQEPRSYYGAAILLNLVGKGKTTIQVDSIVNMAVGPQRTGELMSRSLVLEAVDELVMLEVATLHLEQFGPDMLEVPEYGLTGLSKSLPDSAYGKVVRFGGDWLAKAISNINENPIEGEMPLIEDSAPETKSQEDIWEPLQLERSAPEYEESIAGIEQAIRDIAADNGFSAEFPEERDNLIAHAEATLASAKEGKVTRKQIQENLVAPGKWIASKFAGTAIGTFAAELVKWAFRLLHLFQ